MAWLGLFAYIKLQVQVSLLRFLLRLRSFKQRLAIRDLLKKSSSIKIPSRDRGRSISANLYLPPKVDPNPKLPFPVLINWHGSGFVLQGHGTNAAFCSRMAQDAGIAVLDCDYRKAPEYPFPAAPNDAEDVLKWVISNPQDFDLDHILLCGFSSGANLALVTSTSWPAKLELDHGVRGVVAFYPPTDLSIPVENRYPPNSKYPRATWLYRLAYDCYIPSAADKKDPRMSPMYADVHEFPAHMMFVTCDGDELCPEAEALGQKVNVGSRSVVLHRVEDVRHGFDGICLPGSREERLRDEVYISVAKTIKEIVSIP
ncbi:uncharacterized protein N7443_003496 [Penicillium atrosanguineum]|uniref:uncharacterized protein n=1 Tax=Penicillium atrosanguineum TaxID=1132637 RepID=UPI00239BDD01|nr:uncharacterized protein N7443_003496 [Penicillium atrosanguineum]KAJ5303836.1 hypothetical protein N7443_003496 [Penicillium atrosanguineum]